MLRSFRRRSRSRSRRARPLKKRSPSQKRKGSRKPRMIRRYMPRRFFIENQLEKLIGPGVQTQQPPARNLQASGQDKAKSPPDKLSTVSGGHNAVLDGRISTTRRVAAAVVTSVPNPTPDTGVASTAVTSSNTVNTLGAGAPLLGALTVSDTATSGYTVVQPSTKDSASSSPRTSVVSFSALPPLQSFMSTSDSQSIDLQSLYPSDTSSVPSASPTSQPSEASTRQMSVALVILLSVGGGFLLLGFCIMAKMCTRTKRVRPTPSLPIIKDLEADDDYYEGKESPLFGGKERMSAVLSGDNPGWNWVTYPHVKSTSQTQPLEKDHSCPSTQHQGNRQHQPPQQDHQHQQHIVPAPTDGRFNLATQPPPSHNTSSMASSSSSSSSSMRPVLLQNMAVVAQATKRLSRASLAMYTSTGMPTGQSQQNTPFTADDHDVIKRSKSKTDMRRRSQYGQDDRKHRNSATSFIGLAYDGDESPSPAPAEYSHVIPDTPVQPNDFEGRARVKSGYFATGSYPRHSVLPSTSYSIATATRVNVANRNSLVKDKLSSHQRSTSKRIRDTQALTYALGLGSPRTEYGAPSPQPTLYPEDSMSVIDAARRQKKRNVGGGRSNEPVPDVPVIVPMDKVGGSTETFMGMNFAASQGSLNLPSSQSEESISRLDSTPASTSMRNFGDRVPRVPSPPPLPSLAQMGLQRTSPEAYDNYRSPTYSLYGLYQTADRKSFVNGRS